MNLIPRRWAVSAYQLVSGRRFLTCMDELNRTQWLSRSELEALQQKKLHQIVTYAAQYVPYYQKLFKQVGFQPDEVLTNPAALRKLPVLTKSVIAANFDALLTTEPQRRASLNRLTTGGSTGQPLVFMQDADFRDYVTADIHRHLGWAGWQFGELHAYIWGASFEVKASAALRSQLMNWALNRFVTNAYVLSEQSMEAFAAQVMRRKPRILFGYPSSLYRFAEFVQQHRYPIRFTAIFCSAEVLYPAQRAFIEDVFQGRMFNRYGTRELGGIACECGAHTALHVSSEDVLVEIVRDVVNGEPTAPGESGPIIVTNLNNCGMPFIRYSIEDVGAWSQQQECSCGRQLPLLDLVQGRRIDMFKTRDGRAVWGGFASPMFGMKGVKRFQVIQKSLDLIVMRIVKTSELDEAQLKAIERTAKTALGENIEVRFEFPDDIPVLDSGKYRYAISEVTNPPAA